MARFTAAMDELVEQLDPEAHEDEIATLRRCRSVRELDRLVDLGGWLTAGGAEVRLKLIKHRSGTFLVVGYEDGWSTRIAAQEFPRR